MSRKLVFLIIGLCIAGILIAGCTTPTTTPPATTATPTPVPATTAPAVKTIVSTAVANGNVTTFITALQAAKLDSMLNGPGPFTVFAPSDAAFKSLPNGTMLSLLKDPQGQLKQILLYHVVPGNYQASDLVNMTTLKTLQGANLTINVTKDAVYINNAKVVVTDIRTDNGVIHVVDMVLMPPAPVANTTTTLTNVTAVQANVTTKTGM